MSNSKGLLRGLTFLGIVALAGVFLVPRLPELMMATGITGAATGNTVQQLEIGTPDLQGIDATSEGIFFEYNIPVHNPNSFNAKVDRTTYTVYVAGERVSSGSTRSDVTIPANSEREIRDRVQADLSGSLGAGLDTLSNSLTGDQTYVRIEGQLHVDVGPTSFSIPFQRREPL